MRLPKKALVEYKELIIKHFNLEMSDNEVLHNSSLLMALFERIYQPMLKTKFLELNLPSTN